MLSPPHPRLTGHSLDGPNRLVQLSITVIHSRDIKRRLVFYSLSLQESMTHSALTFVNFGYL